MVGVAEHELLVGHGVQHRVVNGLLRRDGCDRHEAGRVDHAVRGVDAPDASARARRLVHQLEAEEVGRLVGRKLL